MDNLVKACGGMDLCGQRQAEFVGCTCGKRLPIQHEGRPSDASGGFHRNLSKRGDSRVRTIQPLQTGFTRGSSQLAREGDGQLGAWLAPVRVRSGLRLDSQDFSGVGVWDYQLMRPVLRRARKQYG